ncbi:MAG: purine-nucleoside phosphorylase [Clostridiales bacterium]|nr:purine-nucleoside phosphorylase [Clostridiales bacterium]
MFYEKVQNSAEFIKSRTKHNPTIGIILGSGLGALVDLIEDKDIIPYKEIPGFPVGSLAGHAGELVLGKLGGQTVICMSGRFHYYEGFTMKEVTYPVFVMKMLGVENLIVTNACGAINKEFKPGDLMIITDYINILGVNPLIGPNDERFGPRFPDMSEAYSKELIAKAETVADNLGIDYKHGVYALFNGPCYETAAEIRAFAAMGADTVGMSTVPETTVANYLGIKVFGLSCITNMATGIATVKHSHEEVLKTANEASEKLCRWVKELIINW